MICIKGNPGAGKSTLMKYAQAKKLPAKGRSVVVGSFKRWSSMTDKNIGLTVNEANVSVDEMPGSLIARPHQIFHSHCCPASSLSWAFLELAGRETSPVSFLRPSMAPNLAASQNDLIRDMILNESLTIYFASGWRVKRTEASGIFQVDLSGTCWNHQVATFQLK
jgi:hypothetical protein